MQKLEITVEKDGELVSFLRANNLSLGQIKSLLRKKDIKINGKRIKDDTEIKCGDKIEYYLKEDEIERVFEDENVAIVVKPSGIESCGENSLESKLGLFAVHRLDRNTSGLIIFAKNEGSKLALEEVFANNLVRKFYVCEVVGDTNFNGKTYSAYLFKDAKLSKVYISETKKQGSVEIKTKFTTLKHGVQTSVVLAELITGKTHQIRAHLAYLGHHILGDSKYGRNEDNRKFKEFKQKLVCVCLKFGDLQNLEIQNISQKTFTKMPNWFNFNLTKEILN